MKPGDIAYFEDKKFGHHRFWRIEGIFLGALGQEGVIEMRPLSERPASSHPGMTHETVFVPEPMTRLLTIYTPNIG